MKLMILLAVSVALTAPAAHAYKGPNPEVIGPGVRPPKDAPRGLDIAADPTPSENDRAAYFARLNALVPGSTEWTRTVREGCQRPGYRRSVLIRRGICLVERRP